MTEPVNPHRVTIALDRAKLFGPTADAKVGAREPDLDEWEAGRRQPTPGQAARLAQLANVPLEFLWLPDDHVPRVGVALVNTGRTCIRMVTLLEPVPDEPQGTLL